MPRRKRSSPSGYADRSANPRVASGRLLLNPAGFGFVERTDGEPSIFVPPDSRGGAMDGDEVVVSWWPAERGPEGAVRSVTRRQRTRVTGVLRAAGKGWRVEPDDPRVLGRAAVMGDAPRSASGTVVVASIVDYPDPWNEDFTVQVERSLGPPGSLATEEAKILVEQNIDVELPKAVRKAAESVPTRVRKADIAGRDDLRDLDFMTIDPPDARDFDDAVCIEARGRDMKRAKMRVHVAVADVSHYVRETDVFDDEAVKRCFTTYLPSRAIPMLPEQLSSGICSLVPKKDRLAMVVSFDLDPSGKVSEANVRAAVIHSRARLTYQQVAAELSKRGRQPAAVRKRVLTLRLGADRLHAARRRRGAIELSLPEVKIKLDDDDRERIREVAPAKPNPHVAAAYNLIEEFMVAANEVVGRIGVKHRLPMIYRVHDRPDEERLERFAGVAELLGVEAPLDKLRSPKGAQAFLRKIEKHPRRTALNGLLLRALAQAEYATHNVGHFALGSTAYAHFTSPIRRYPDLVNHRVLKAWIHGGGGSAGPDPVPRMPAMKSATGQAKRCSERERAVIQAERDAKSLMCAAYMRDRVGDRFEATVSGMSPGGIYAMLDKPPVDGVIRRALLERETREAYDVDDLGAVFVGRKTGRRIKIGDRLVVEVTGVSLQRRQIELAMIGLLTA